MSEDFDDWVNYWKHNGYWFFNSPTLIEDIAKENNINLERMKLFSTRFTSFNGVMKRVSGKNSNQKHRLKLTLNYLKSRY
jgi:hypothetical protein